MSDQAAPAPQDDLTDEDAHTVKLADEIIDVLEKHNLPSRPCMDALATTLITMHHAALAAGRADVCEEIECACFRLFTLLVKKRVQSEAAPPVG